MFLWCHVRHINLSNKHPERIKNDKQIAEELDYDEFEFPVREKDFNKIEKYIYIYIYVLMCLVMKIDWFFQFIFQIKNLKIQWICYF